MSERSAAVLKEIVFAAIGLALVAWFVPPWLHGYRPYLEGWYALRLLGVVPLIVGALAGSLCVMDFAWTGHGTPAPIDPPKHLVVRGMYAHVRNPMYVGFGSAIVSGWIAFGRFSWIAVLAAAAVVGFLVAFVRLYEEPTLRRKFGADYDEYCRNVPRWVPRLRGWKPHAKSAEEKKWMANSGW